MLLDEQKIISADAVIDGNGHDGDKTPNNDRGIVISNVTAKWDNGQRSNTLEAINLTVEPGQLVALIGPVGAGKVCVRIIFRDRQGSVGCKSRSRKRYYRAH